jgi:hypothetical protein
MHPDDKPVPQPGEAHREDGEVRYYDTDETNVGGTAQEPRTDDAPPAAPEE